MSGRFLTTEETAERLRCSLRTVQQLIANEEIPHRKLGGMRRILVDPAELDAYMAGGVRLETVELGRGGRCVRVKRPA